MKSLQLKVLSVVASALAVVGVAVAPQATAAERNLVAFGDSVLADPDAGSYFAHRYDPSKGVGVDCPTSNNYAKRAGAKLRLPVPCPCLAARRFPSRWMRPSAAVR